MRISCIIKTRHIIVWNQKKAGRKCMKDWYTEKESQDPFSVPFWSMNTCIWMESWILTAFYLKKRREHIGTYKVADMEALFPLDAKRFREYRKDKNIKIRDCSAGRRGMRYGMLIPESGAEGSTGFLNQIRECSWICKDVLRKSTICLKTGLTGFDKFDKLDN